MHTLKCPFRHKGIHFLLASFLSLSGCAKSSKDIQGTYVSSFNYQGFECSQLDAEMNHLQAKTLELGRQVDKKAQNQKDAAMSLGPQPYLWPFAPILLLHSNDKEVEYSHLKGELEAIQTAAESKKCREMKQQK